MILKNDQIFNLKTARDFEAAALSTFSNQYQGNQVYRRFCDYLNRTPETVHSLDAIPYLPIEFFKKERILVGEPVTETIFTSSGTTGALTSKHLVPDLALYEKSFYKAFEQFYGAPKDFCILALLPSYLEREGSSLVYMVAALIKDSKHPASGFYLNDHKALISQLAQLENQGQKTILIGVSFALLDLAAIMPFPLKSTLIMETGGMKGRRKEMIRNELHEQLQEGFGVSEIHSEYGMTELLSQAYSTGNGRFTCPAWMKVSTRDTEDPLSKQAFGKTGGINIIDLANQHSCAFIATQDLGKVYEDHSFEVLGRFDHSDIRGCNLMVM